MSETIVLGRMPSVLTRSQVLKAVELAVKVSRKKAEGDISVAFVTESAIRKLNQRHRGFRRPTDVLSFASSDPRTLRRTLRAGDIFVASAYVRRDASKAGVDYRTQLARVIVHGTLHLMGFDHQKTADAKKMFALQERVLDGIL